MDSFDPTKPSTPISFPILELADLESGSYYRSFHFPFNKASVPLPESAACGMPDRRRILVCHDMMGGYADDKWIQGGDNADAYAIWHWYLMDVFVYFSHSLVTIPLPCWTNAGHTHGVKVLGTFIVEWEKGAEICKTLLAMKESAQMYAEKLAELASALGFDGWLINVEVDYMDKEQIVNLKEFVGRLTEVIHKAVRGSLIIWYDSVTIDGWRVYQNQLNEKNKPFFDLCDGIFINYFWRTNGVNVSASFAGNRRHDVYMGIDVWGRGTYGGGGWDDGCTNIYQKLIFRVTNIAGGALLRNHGEYFKTTLKCCHFIQILIRVMVFISPSEAHKLQRVHGITFPVKAFSLCLKNLRLSLMDLWILKLICKFPSISKITLIVEEVTSHAKEVLEIMCHLHQGSSRDNFLWEI